MAQELKIVTGHTYANGNAKDSLGNQTYPVTQTVQELWRSIVVVGTGEEDLVPVDITTNGWLRLENLDATNLVKFGPKSAGVMVEFGRLKAGEPPAWFRLAPGVTLRWIAITASVKVDVRLFGD